MIDPNKQRQLEDKLLSNVELNDGPEFRPEDLPLKKRMFFAAMVRSFGNVQQSCEISGIKRKTYSGWMAHDKNFRRLMEEGEFQERALDFAESKLISEIEKGNIIAILFFLKTKGKKRGYIEGNIAPQPPRDGQQPSWFDLPSPTKTAEFIEEAEVIPNTQNVIDTRTAAAEEGSELGL